MKTLSTILDFVIDEKFLIPFLSTLGAALAIIVGQQIFGFSARQKKKLYCIAYISDVADRLLFSNLIVKKTTILPHIKATKEIIKGNNELLDIMFKADEFDILTGKTIEFNHLPEEYKLLVGFDSIKTLQAIEFVTALSVNDSSKISLNDFVKNNLKKGLHFDSQSDDEKLDILNTYWDYLDQVDRDIDRINGFIVNILIPTIEKYKNRFGFKFFNKKQISQNIKQIRKIHKQFEELIPNPDDIKNSINNGIQKVL
ncbi:MAG: hypothetical protein PHE08_12290 [Bacteroidales bacterium]|nr:hypothetical protein [Bacteroidales bacterium]